MIDTKLYDMIYKRKSFHIFRNIGEERLSTEELTEIEDMYAGFVPLYTDIRTAIRIVPAEETTCRRGQEYCILLYSEKKPGYLQNIGYLGQQLDLWLVSKNIGTLWFGIGKAEEPQYEGLDFVIMIAVSKVDDPVKFRKNMFKSKRKPVGEIWEGPEITGVTDIVRFAPSACNSQPWIVKHDNGQLEVYRYKKQGKRGIMPADKVSYYNRIDTGIFLCFMDLCLEHEGFSFERKLADDPGNDDEMTLNAVYKVKR